MNELDLFLNLFPTHIILISINLYAISGQTMSRSKQKVQNNYTKFSFRIFTLATILTTHFADNPSYGARYLTF